jgi:uncharacterized lipoprotein YmbA
MKLRLFFRPSLLLVAGAWLLAATGCNLIPPSTPDATRYYVLTTTAAKPAAPAADGPHWRIALRTVEVPSFLRGKAMQVRTAGNEIHYAEEARWAESLEAGLGRVLHESLESRAEIAHVVANAAEDPDFDVAVRVLRCEGDRDAKVARFSAVVEVYAPRLGAELRARDTFVIEIPGWNGDYGQLAAKLSTAVDGLAGNIVTLLGTAGNAGKH